MAGSAGLSATSTTEEIESLARRISKEVLAKNAERLDQSQAFPAEAFDALGDAGLMGMLCTEEFGGLGASYLKYVRVTEALAAGCGSTSLLYVMHSSQYVMIADNGTQRQKEYFLPDVAAGKSFFASATTEREVGGNAQVCVSAKSQEDDYIELTVDKPVVSGIENADWVCVTTRARPDAPPNMLSVVVAPGLKRDPSLDVYGTWDCVGMRATGSIGIRYKGCRVPTWHQIGSDDSGSVRINSFVPVAVLGYAATWVGIAQGALDEAVAHLLSRKLHAVEGADNAMRTLADYDTVQFQVADAYTRIECARAVLRRCARMLDDERAEHGVPMKGIPGQVQPVLWAARISASEAAIEVCRIALRICGVTGLRHRRLSLERLMRDALTSQVMAPGEDRSKLILGRTIVHGPRTA